jgi:hypothetical protein
MQLEEERDWLKKELAITTEILAQVINVTGPVKIKKGEGPEANSQIDLDFDPTGAFVVVSLK